MLSNERPPSAVFRLLTWEQRLQRENLRHEAAHRPHVHGGRLRRGAQQDLGRAVPSRAHIGREGRGGLLGPGGAARESEVSQLEGVGEVGIAPWWAALGEQDVFRLTVLDWVGFG